MGNGNNPINIRMTAKKEVNVNLYGIWGENFLCHSCTSRFEKFLKYLHQLLSCTLYLSISRIKYTHAIAYFLSILCVLIVLQTCFCAHHYGFTILTRFTYHRLFCLMWVVLCNLNLKYLQSSYTRVITCSFNFDIWINYDIA